MKVHVIHKDGSQTLESEWRVLGWRLVLSTWIYGTIGYEVWLRFGKRPWIEKAFLNLSNFIKNL